MKNGREKGGNGSCYVKGKRKRKKREREREFFVVVEEEEEDEEVSRNSIETVEDKKVALETIQTPPHRRT